MDTGARSTRLARVLVRTAAIEDRIQLLSKKYGLTPERLRRILKLDPTGGSYLEWLARQYNEDFFLVVGSEDQLSVTQCLRVFDRIKRSPALLRDLQESPDINRYNIESLRDLIIKAYDHDHTISNRQKNKQNKQSGAKVIYDKPPMKIVQIGGPDVDPEAAAFASCVYSRGTQWCVSNLSTAKYYLQEGPLCLILRDNKKVAMYYPAGGQLKDITDHDLVLSEKKNRDIITALIDSGVDMPAQLVDRLDEFGYTLTPKLQKILDAENAFRSTVWGGL